MALSYTQKGNNFYIFMEGDEVEKLGREKIQGLYFNSGSHPKPSTLEIEISDRISERMLASTEENEEGFVTRLLVEMRRREWTFLSERGMRELHEGKSHICFRDAGRKGLCPADLETYEQLKSWRNNLQIQEAH